MWALCPPSPRCPTSVGVNGCGHSSLWNLQQIRYSSIPPIRRPLRLNLHNSNLRERVVPKTTPLPLLRFRNQPPFHRIPMDIPQFPLETFMRSHVMVVITLLPQRTISLRPIKPRSPRYRNFQSLDRLRQYSLRRLRHQQMHMLRHDHISIDSKQVRAPHPLQALDKQIANPRFAK